MDERLTIHPTRFCVYIHHFLEGGIAYIGHGTAERPLEFNRTTLWHIFLDEGFTLEIFQWFDSKEQAIELEEDMIKYYKPPINMHGIDKSEDLWVGKQLCGIDEKLISSLTQKISSSAMRLCLGMDSQSQNSGETLSTSTRKNWRKAGSYRLSTPK